MCCSFTLPNFAIRGADRYIEAIITTTEAANVPNNLRIAINISTNAAACRII